MIESTEAIGPWKYAIYDNGEAKLTRYGAGGEFAETMWRLGRSAHNPSEALKNQDFDNKLAEIRAQYAPDKVACSVETKSYLRRPGVSDKVGPFETEADAKMAAILLNCYHHEAKSTWEAYSIKTITEEKFL